MHTTMLGDAGLKSLATLNHAQACSLANKVKKVDGVELLNKTFFNEFTVALPQGVSAANVVDAMAKKGILAGVPASRLFGKPDDNLLLLAATEMNTPREMEQLTSGLRDVLKSC